MRAIHCDRCKVVIPEHEQGWECTIAPHRIDQAGFRPDSITDLCTSCLRGLKRYLAGDEVLRLDGPCKQCGMPSGHLPHEGWGVWRDDPCDGQCGYGSEHGPHTHHPFEFDEHAAALVEVGRMTIG